MLQSPLEANSRSASEIFRLLWNPKFHYFVYNSQSLVSTVSRVNPIHTL
jgi:hypothetical protein